MGGENPFLSFVSCRRHRGKNLALALLRKEASRARRDTHTKSANDDDFDEDAFHRVLGVVVVVEPTIDGVHRPRAFPETAAEREEDVIRCESERRREEGQCFVASLDG